MDSLVDLSQEHALQSVELRRHLLGEVLQVGRLDHLQTLTGKRRKWGKRGLKKEFHTKLQLRNILPSHWGRGQTTPPHWVSDRAIITGEKQTNRSLFIKKQEEKRC